MISKVDFMKAPPVTDIPERLRRLADAIEAGQVPCEFGVVAWAELDGRVRMTGFGRSRGVLADVGLLARAQAKALKVRDRTDVDDDEWTGIAGITADGGAE
jgi:hypothetical protein